MARRRAASKSLAVSLTVLLLGVSGAACAQEPAAAKNAVDIRQALLRLMGWNFSPPSGR